MTQDKKNIFGWIMYDFANSSFTTIIVTVIYSVYFKNVVVGAGEKGTKLWGIAVSISMLLVAIGSPIFGAVADYSHTKKKFLAGFCYLSVVFTVLMYFVKPGDVAIGMILFIIANFGFNSSNVFYNAFLPEISTNKTIGKISGFGWAFGYVGGLVSLIISLFVLKINIRLVFPVVGLFYGLFALITFYFLKEKEHGQRSDNYFLTAYKRIKYSYQNIMQFKELLKFFISYFIINDGIVIVISFASIYGATMFQMSSKELIWYFIIAQITSIFGAAIFGFIFDKIGGKLSLSITLLIWIGVVILAFFCPNKEFYYFVGLVAGIAIGSSQSITRTILATLTPTSKMTEFFGFYSFTGKFSSIFGPLIYGYIAYLTGSQRWAILAVILFFVTGAIILQTVDMEKGIKTAKSF